MDCKVCFIPTDYFLSCECKFAQQCVDCVYGNLMRCCYCNSKMHMLDKIFTEEIPFEHLKDFAHKYLRFTTCRVNKLVDPIRFAVKTCSAIMNLLQKTIFIKMTKANTLSRFIDNTELFQLMEDLSWYHKTIIKGLVCNDIKLVRQSATTLLNTLNISLSEDCSRIFFELKKTKYYAKINEVFKIFFGKSGKYVKIRVLNMCLVFCCKKFKFVEQKKTVPFVLYEQNGDRAVTWNVKKKKTDILKAAYVIALNKMFDMKNVFVNEDCSCNKISCKKCNKNYCSICLNLLSSHDESRCIVPENVENYKICPGCKILQFKAYGCDDMWCPSCGVFFSWKDQKIINGSPHNPNAMQELYKRKFNSDLKESIFMDTVNINDGYCNFFPDKLVEIASDSSFDYLKKRKAFIDSLQQMLIARVLDVDTVDFDSEGKVNKSRNFEILRKLIECCRRYKEIIVSLYSFKEYKRCRIIYTPLLSVDTLSGSLYYAIY